MTLTRTADPSRPWGGVLTLTDPQGSTSERIFSLGSNLCGNVSTEVITLRSAVWHRDSDGCDEVWKVAGDWVWRPAPLHGRVGWRRAERQPVEATVSRDVARRPTSRQNHSDMVQPQRLRRSRHEESLVPLLWRYSCWCRGIQTDTSQRFVSDC